MKDLDDRDYTQFDVQTGSPPDPDRLSRPAGQRQRRLAIPGRRPGGRSSKSNMLGPDLEKLAELLRRADEAAEQGRRHDRRRHDALAAQARGAGGVDREAASDLGIPVHDRQYAAILVGGMPVSTFRDGGRTIRCLAAGRKPATRSSARTCTACRCPRRQWARCQLSNLARLDEQRGPSQIER